MPRLLLCAGAAALLLVAIAPAAPVPAHLQKPPVYYFPTKVGTKLEYEEPGRHLIMVVTAVKERGGAKIVSVGRVERDESVSPLMTMAVTGTGLYRLERLGRKLDPQETWLKLPARSKDTWEYLTGDSWLSERPKACFEVLGTEEVTVPAGTFQAIGVRCIQNGRMVTNWYAPDVGLVKTTAATWEEVLKSYTLGKD